MERRIRRVRFLLIFVFYRLMNLILSPFLIPFLLSFSRIMFRYLCLVVLFLFLGVVEWGPVRNTGLRLF